MCDCINVYNSRNHNTGGAANLAVKALFPYMHCWAQTLQVWKQDSYTIQALTRTFAWGMDIHNSGSSTADMRDTACVADLAVKALLPHHIWR